MHVCDSDLNGNRLQRVKGLMFQGLSNVVSLRLRRNLLAELMDGALYGLTSVQTMYVGRQNAFFPLHTYCLYRYLHCWCSLHFTSSLMGRNCTLPAVGNIPNGKTVLLVVNLMANSESGTPVSLAILLDVVGRDTVGQTEAESESECFVMLQLKLGYIKV